ncbi:MAG TPA: alpha/beta hydrolase [Clostridia bacterium]|nr:alpha/beta hydrolase [Clostridia bacterium]
MRTEIGGVHIEYERVGAGKPVLILHGWGASMEAVRPIANCLTGLGREAILLDFPGFGNSQEPPEPWGVPEYAVLTREFMRRLGIEGCDVACHSFGGRVTIYLTSEEPKIFDRLVLVDAAGIRPRRGLGYYARVLAYKLGKKLAGIGPLERAFKLTEKQRGAGSADYRALKSDVMRATFVKVVNLDLTDRLSQIENETLLVWGDRDDYTPLYMGKLMEAKIRNSGLAVLEGAGHFSYADKYQQFCAVMRAFFKD